MRLVNSNNSVKSLTRGLLFTILIVGLTVGLIKYLTTLPEPEVESEATTITETKIITKDPDTSSFEGIGLEDPDARKAFQERPRSEREQIKKLTRIYLGNKEDRANNVSEPSNEEKAAAFITVQKKFFYKNNKTIAGYFVKKLRDGKLTDNNISISDITHTPFSPNTKTSKTSVEVLIIEQCGYTVTDAE